MFHCAAIEKNSGSTSVVEQVQVSLRNSHEHSWEAIVSNLLTYLKNKVKDHNGEPKLWVL
jgi:hypothetical protein